MASPTEPGALAAAPPAQPRQRWRVVFARDPGHRTEPHRAVVERIEEALSGTGLPFLADPRRGERPKLAFGAPLPVGVAADRDLFDVWLTELRPATEVRRAIEASLPGGYRVVDAYDVWLGAPALAASVAGAIYVVDLDLPPAAASALAAAIDEFLAASSVPRTRAKGSGEVGYDLRPLVEDVRLEPVDASTPGARILIQVRFDPGLGSGRPDEVVAALSERLDRPVAAKAIRRERLVLSGAD